MPTYEYECQKCGQVFEVRQSFSDKPIGHCQVNGCRGRVRKLFRPPAIIFKGSGFHVNDYGRGSGTEKRSADSKPDSAACKGCESAQSCPAKGED